MAIMYVQRCQQNMYRIFITKTECAVNSVVYGSFNTHSLLPSSPSHAFLDLFFYRFCKFTCIYNVYQVSLTCTSRSLKMLDLPFQHAIENLNLSSSKCAN